MFKDDRPMLVPVTFDIIKKPWNPDRTDYILLDRKEYPRNIITKLDKRCPPQPPMPILHPDLDVGVVLRAMIKGDLPADQLTMIKDAFYDAVRRRSLDRDLKSRVTARRDEIDRDYADFYLRTKLAELARMEFIFQLGASRAIRTRHDVKKVFDHVQELREPRQRQQLKARDQNGEETREAYDDAVLRGLEKMPREIVVSAGTLQQVLAELSESYPSKVLLAYRNVQENIMRAFADQLNDHFKHAVPTAVLYTASTNMRPKYSAAGSLHQGILNGLDFAGAAQILRDNAKAEANAVHLYADQLNDHNRPNSDNNITYYASTEDQRLVFRARVKENRAHVVQANDELAEDTVRTRQTKDGDAVVKLVERSQDARANYWGEFDHRHEKLIRPQMLAATNLQSQANEFSRQGSSAVQRVLRAVDQNQDILHADQILENSSGNLEAAILYALSVLPKQFPTINQILLDILDREIAERRVLEKRGEKFEEFQLLRNDRRHTTMQIEQQIEEGRVDQAVEHSKNLEARSLKSVAGREMYWQIFDSLHEKAPRALAGSSQNQNSILREFGHQDQALINYILSMVQDNAARASGNDLRLAMQALLSNRVLSG